MVGMSLAYRKNSGRAHTPGELDGKTSAEHYMSPGKSAGGYIPAYKGEGRRLPMTDAFQLEAGQCNEPELDVRTNSKFDRVFGNGLFEDAGPPPARAQPSVVKLNSYFDDPNKLGSPTLNRSLNQDSPLIRTGTSEREAGTPERQLGMLASRHTASVARLQAYQQQQQLQGGNQGQFEETAVELFEPVMESEGGAAPMVISRVPIPLNVNAGRPKDRSVAAWESQLKVMISQDRREEAVKLAAPSSGLVRCYIKRVKNFLGTHCSFQLHLDNGDVFLLAARRRKKSKVSSYVVSLDLEDLKRDTDNCLGKVKANFLGTEYVLWGKGGDGGSKSGFNQEQLCINFKQTSLSTKSGPRAMYVVLPLPELEWAPTDPGGQDSLSNSLELAKRRELPHHMERKVAMLSTKPPEFDDNLKAYTLDFHGRVKEASVKNFQLVHWDHNTDRKGVDLMLQFGKMGEELYALDFAYPLTIEMAFAVALASIDTKLCYTL